MRRIAAVLMAVGVGMFALTPSATALGLNLGPVEVNVDTVVETPLADVNLDADVDLLSDPLVHVCVNGQVVSVLASVAANLHLDVLGSDSDCAPLPTTPVPPTSTPDDPLVHVCVNGVVQSVLASVALDAHLDVLGVDELCPPPAGGPTTPPPGSDDPLVHVCVNGVVKSELLSVALNLHLDILGTDNKCPAPTTPTTKPPTTTPTTTVVTQPHADGTGNGPTATVPTATSSDNTVTEEPAAKKTGPLAFTGNGLLGILFILGAGLGATGLLLGLLGAVAKRRAA